ncbi:FISUMP domain-containing protein [Fibrobacter sp. UWB7]|uniref:FISUMP domain-containing protein n=1 Tax=Fibrobacter sp. UWB7 TaxID=1896206 RepID=UPI00091260EF|nr:FISUMP domain-containing protein [Fibrobacter sp. UWB7]SHL96969.1 major paralogous domain-containing protein [Fibrobacter sp. UWB7]
MKKSLLSIYYRVTCVCLGIIFVACSDNATKSSDESYRKKADYEVSQLGDLPKCNSSTKGKTASVGLYGKEYVCDCRDWVDVEMQQMIDEGLERARNNHANDSILAMYDKAQKSLGNLPCVDSYSNQDKPKDSKETGKYSSSSKANPVTEEPIDIGDTLANGKDTLFSSSSSISLELSDFEKEEVVKIENATLAGVAQKGPYLQGGIYRIIPLDGDTFKPVGDTLTDYFKASDGYYSFSDLKMPSQYAFVDANGYYLNELTGKKSGLQVSIGAIVDVQMSANVNIITDLEYERVKYLVLKKEYNIAGAKKRAFSEVLAAFHIDSVTGVASELDITKIGDANGTLLALSIIVQNAISSGIYMMKDFREDIKEDGEWNDKATRAKMADLAYESDNAEKLSTYKEYVVKWGGKVPNYESYVNEFWSGEYGLEKCSGSTVGKIKKNQNALSAYKNNYFVCENSKWRFIDQLEYNTYNRECDVEGTIISGIIDKDLYYKCEMKYDYAGYKIGLMWREATALEGGVYYWDGEYESFVDDRDGRVYKSVNYGSQKWMAENLKFTSKENGLAYGHMFTYGDSEIDSNRVVYSWGGAMDSAGIYSTNGINCGTKIDDCFPSYPVRGICPEGWHLPTSSEWENLYSAMGNTPYAMQAKGYDSWPEATDAYGFSVLPTYLSSYTDFWTATYSDAGRAKTWDLGRTEARLGQQMRRSYISVRCAKNTAK